MLGKANGSGIGQPVRRREDLRLITGRGRYSDDLNLPGQAYACMVRSPHAHALIRNIDVGAARAAPGVLAVLTSQEMRADGLNPLPHISNNHPADIAIKNKNGAPVVRPRHQPIVFPEVCHVGELVAVVVAETVAAAMRTRRGPVSTAPTSSSTARSATKRRQTRSLPTHRMS
jgi:aerobic carbon-monoxide dehydrogenase large subunit